MAITLADAKAQLNLDVGDHDDDAELQGYVDAANEWVAIKATDTTRAALYPNLLRLASLFLVEDWWESQRGPVASPITGDDEVIVNGRSYAIPNRVRELLAPFLTSTAPSFSFPQSQGWPDSVERTPL